MLADELGIIHRESVIVEKWANPLFANRGVETDVLRLDKIHPVISGNKWFKLKNYLQEAIANGYSSIITFGGAYSNHVVATACAVSKLGLRSIGFIRGERSDQPSASLQSAEGYGMVLQYISRVCYKSIRHPDFLQALSRQYPDSYIIPEGGAGEKGIAGAAEIMQWVHGFGYSHILCAVGTGTLFLGLVRGRTATEHIKGVCVLKGMPDLVDQFKKLQPSENQLTQNDISYDYHFGGYAKRTSELISFMNQLYLETAIPTDFVYTGKLFYAVKDMISKQHFPYGSKILIIHSGGLQGNLSLPAETLIYFNELPNQ
jgi:1-aminocyclopropane-1-carboxylate deaminase